MPSYQYKCSSENCENETTIECKMSQYQSEIPCEKCGEIMTRKPEDLVTGYVAKCSGFYGKISN